MVNERHQAPGTSCGVRKLGHAQAGGRTSAPRVTHAIAARRMRHPRSAAVKRSVAPTSASTSRRRLTGAAASMRVWGEQRQGRRPQDRAQVINTQIPHAHSPAGSEPPHQQRQPPVRVGRRYIHHTVEPACAEDAKQTQPRKRHADRYSHAALCTSHTHAPGRSRAVSIMLG